jgi:hypothetical protein
MKKFTEIRILKKLIEIWILKNVPKYVYWKDLLKIVNVFHVWLKSDSMNGQFTWRPS